MPEPLRNALTVHAPPTPADKASSAPSGECAVFDAVPEEQISHISALETSNKVILQHQIFDKGTWRRARYADHPRASFKLTLVDHRQSRVNQPVTIDGIADTGAQSNLWGLQNFQEAGYSLNDLRPVSLNIRAANKNPINVIGAFPG